MPRDINKLDFAPATFSFTFYARVERKGKYLDEKLYL